MRIVIDSRIGNFARIFAYDDDGKELYQLRRDITEDLKDAAKAKRSLEEIVAKKLGAQYELLPEQPPAEVHVSVIPSDRHEHLEYMRTMPEHAHSRAMETEHDLRVAIAQVERFAASIKAALEGYAGLAHEHPHNHEEVMKWIAALERGMAEHGHPIPQHEHVHNHPASEHALQELTDEVTRLNGVIAALERRLDSHGHEYLSKMPEHEHSYLKEMPAHEHPKAEIRQQAWVVLSEQEVAGKRRLVVEEAS